MNIGDACVCSPTRIDSQAQQIIVRLGAGKAEARCPFDEAFSQAGAPYSVYSGSLCTRHHDDVVELDRPFVAEVTSLNPLTVSRRRRLNTLWSELEAAAGQDRLFLAQVHRQRSDSYRLLLEGNLMFWAEKAPLESYLSECGYKGLQLRRMTPQEGDMVPLKILSADRTSQHVSVDLASPLTRLQTDNLSAELLHILEVPSHLAASPSGPAPRVTHPRSDFNIPNLGNAPVILVVDDDEHFRAFLVQELSLLGATASHCEPLKVVEALTAGNFVALRTSVGAWVRDVGEKQTGSSIGEPKIKRLDRR